LNRGQSDLQSDALRLSYAPNDNIIDDMKPKKNSATEKETTSRIWVKIN
jgi:hypothetical protein